MTRILATILFLIAAMPLARAQGGPPLLDDPDYWQIHDQNGPIPYTIKVELIGYLGDLEWWEFVVYKDGAYVDWCWAFVDPWDLTGFDVYNHDSRKWTEWIWNDDHYDKVGGTSSVRKYYPVKE